MKLAVFSDIHGNLVALDAVIADLKAIDDVDTVWILGDLAAFGPRPSECIQRLRDLQQSFGEGKCHIIGGNTDRYMVTGERPKLPPAETEEVFNSRADSRYTVDTMLHWSLSLISWDDYQFLAKIIGREVSLNVNNYGRVIGYHAIPGNDETGMTSETPEEEASDYMLDREGRLGIGGHIHRQMDRRLTGNSTITRIVNTGSVGMSFDLPSKAQWVLFTFDDGDVSIDFRAVPYDVDAMLTDLEKTNCPRPEWPAGRVRSGA
jgi:predicted phosphodiesterase